MKYENSVRAEMKWATYFLVFLFYFQSGCFGNPVPEAELTPLRVYNYHGQIEATSSGFNETVSRWTVSGKLSLYLPGHKVIIKLDDVKTSVFNGPRSDLQNVHEKEIPEEAKVLLQPFAITREYVGNIFINFMPNEPLWSKNFKRGLAINLDLETDMEYNIQVAYNNKGASFKEWTIYGQCDVHYDVVMNDTGIVYQRSFNHTSCEKTPLKYKSNLFSNKYLEDYKSKTVKTGVLLDKNSTDTHHHVSESYLKAKIMPASSISQYFYQLTKLDLVESTAVEHPIDSSQITDKHELTYEFGDEPTSGRHTYDNSVAGLTKQFLDNYDTFENYFLYSPIQHVDMNSQDSVENMYLALKRLDVDGLKHLEEEITKREDNSIIFEMYYTLLPYVGTHASVKYLTILLQHDWKTNDVIATKIMAVFPIFVENYSQELLEELEPLMNTKHFDQQSARNAGPLSFASLVSHTGMSGHLKKTAHNKYIKLYIQKFMDSETYEERMVYLLGLINLGEIFDLHLMNHIITNTTESRHIRTLALAGFKHLLVKYSNVTELYNMYVPILLNKQEPFELRVGALDLLLSVNLSEEQFKSKMYNMDFNDPEDIQIANYVLTSLHSLQDTTHFHDYLGKQASDALKHINIRSFSTFATGNYRFTHTDKDIGAYVQFRVITDPSTNIINQVQITYKSYGFNYELNGYSLYLNIDGLFDALYASQFLKNLQVFENVSSVPELLTVLKENKFEIKSGDKPVHIDIIVFKHNTAIYAVHFDEFHRSKMMHLAEDAEQYLQSSIHIQFPLINYVQLPSDLGTPLQFTNVGEDITYAKFEDKHLIYRSTWNYQTWIESYNPLVDTNIASYKYIGLEKALNLKFTVRENLSSFSWLNKKDSFVLYTDNILGTSVEDEKILKQYCENCEAYIDVAPDCTEESISKYGALGFKINITKEGHEMERSCTSSFMDSFNEFFRNDDYKSNFDASPNAGPVLLMIHAIHHKILFGNELSRTSYRSVPYYNEDTVTSVALDANMNFKLASNNPINKKILNVTIQVDNKIVNHTDVSSKWKVDYGLVLDPEYTDDNGEKKVAYFVTFNIKHIAADDEESYKVCVKRELFFPTIRADKYSLKPRKPSTGKFVRTNSKDLEGDDGVCNPKSVSTTTVDLSASEKADKLKNKQNKNDYDECLASSKDLEYTAPTKACRRISSRLSDYDKYKARIPNLPENDGDELAKTIVHVIEFAPDGNDYLNLSYNLHDNTVIKYFHKRIYYPSTFNPSSMFYLDSDSAIPFFATKKCIIAPKTIEQFSGREISNQNQEWFAFAECYNVSTKGLTGHKIDKHHIGFTYRSDETVFTGTVKEGKAHFQLDGKELHKTFDDEDSALKVFFLADNVVIIIDNKINIYYNTEYVEVKVDALYSKLLCGACTQDQ